MGRTTGTKEWADTNVNIQLGCSHGCLYCYAYRIAKRYKRITDMDSWIHNISFNQKKIDKDFGKRKGRIMFPSTHDITGRNQQECRKVLRKILRAGNNVLITSKPNSGVFLNLRQSLYKYKEQILFRFTITSIDDNVIHLFEPYAPTLHNRMESLENAFVNGWKTSVSIEPYLDEDPTDLIKRVEPFVTDTIWLGPMSYPGMMYVPDGSPIDPMLFAKRYNKINISRFMKEALKAGKGKLRLKDSIKKMFSEPTIKKWSKKNVNNSK